MDWGFIITIVLWTVLLYQFFIVICYMASDENSDKTVDIAACIPHLLGMAITGLAKGLYLRSKRKHYSQYGLFSNGRMIDWFFATPEEVDKMDFNWNKAAEYHVEPITKRVSDTQYMKEYYYLGKRLSPNIYHSTYIPPFIRKQE